MDVLGDLPAGPPVGGVSAHSCRPMAGYAFLVAAMSVPTTQPGMGDRNEVLYPHPGHVILSSPYPAAEVGLSEKESELTEIR